MIQINKIIRQIKQIEFIKLTHDKFRDYKVQRKIAPYVKTLREIFDREYSVITPNCFGGHVVQDLKMRYNTPTAGLYFMYPDYIEFLKDIKYYLTEAKIQFVNESKYPLGNERLKNAEHWYPVGLLDGKIEIHFLHYKTEEEAASKWYRRSARVNFDKLLILGMEQNLCSKDDIVAFDSLTFEHKIMFSTQDLHLDSNVFIKEFVRRGEVGNPYLDADVFYKYLIPKLKEIFNK